MAVSLTDEEFDKLDKELKALREGAKTAGTELDATKLRAAFDESVKALTAPLEAKIETLTEAVDKAERSEKESVPEIPSFDNALQTWAFDNVDTINGRKQVKGDVVALRCGVIQAALDSKIFTFNDKA